ncbi:hypothetical protein X943_003213 [Babesia divergens]|uniref:Autophagy-related protein 3 n=1 Tax=Babesia divergens TaxID=32595 RepID=A0AAD9GK69_BABDI|nr:hypothetical protein X943_003213 [Babesia divergens]
MYDLLLTTASELLPPTGFDFHRKGAVTPSDFINSGDYLVKTDHRWQWVEDYSDAALDYLSGSKQYLRAHSIPCLRIRPLVTQDTDDWVVCDTTCKTNVPELYDNEANDRPYRRYDVSITYDRYYETPRIWLVGFNIVGLPLSAEEMLQDVPPIYAGKTVTISRHPYTARLNMTVHPCYQMEAIRRGKDKTQPCNVQNAISLALNIWASVLPSICLMESNWNTETNVNEL